MRYYKLISDTTFIGIASSNDFRRFQLKHRLMLKSDEVHGCYIYYDGQYYRANWMKSPIDDITQYTVIDAIQITEDEYTTLKIALKSDEEIKIGVESIQEQEEPIQTEGEETPPPPEEDPDATLEYIKSSKIKEMSVACRKTITNGFDITLSDNISHHFSLTVQDQLNLLTVSTDILSGESEIIYHADGEVCKYYSVEDATSIVNAATKHKTYHTTYYNSLKVYINSLNGITEISNIEYGVEIPEEYQSDILKSLIQENINDENNTIEDEEPNAEVDDINNDSIVEDE